MRASAAAGHLRDALTTGPHKGRVAVLVLGVDAGSRAGELKRHPAVAIFAGKEKRRVVEFVLGVDVRTSGPGNEARGHLASFPVSRVGLGMRLVDT